MADKTPMNVSTVKIADTEAINLLVAGGYIRAAQAVMPLKVSEEMTNEERAKLLGFIVAGSFNYALGFELLFKSIILSLPNANSLTAQGHALFKDFETLLSEVPELGANVALLVQPNPNGEEPLEKTLECVKNLDACYMRSRYLGLKSRKGGNLEHIFPNTNMCQTLCLVFIATFPQLKYSLPKPKFVK